ncbi:MAG TPA: hypothetical protein VIH08_06545, partial [Blastococcus sp.]
RNDVGLLSEEYDPAARRQVGNTPQAFTLVGLVNTALHLSGTHPARAAAKRHAGEGPDASGRPTAHLAR